MCVEHTEMEANDMLWRPLKGEAGRRGLVGDMCIYLSLYGLEKIQNISEERVTE